MKSENPLRGMRETMALPSHGVQGHENTSEGRRGLSSQLAWLEREGEAGLQRGEEDFQGSQRVEAESGQPERGKSWHPDQDRHCTQRTCVPGADSWMAGT